MLREIVFTQNELVEMLQGKTVGITTKLDGGYLFSMEEKPAKDYTPLTRKETEDLMDGKNKRHSERSAEIWKRENEKKYSDILNMSNKEAATIIKNAAFNVYGGRGNGKTLSLLTMQSAFAKAIKLLEETPDTATDIVEKEAKNRYSSWITSDDDGGIRQEDLMNVVKSNFE